MKNSPEKLLLIGDSLIEFYDWQARFPGKTIWNLGRAGETVNELHSRINEIICEVPEPDWLLIMIGTNNVAMEDYGILGSYGEIIEACKAGYPDATLVISALFPMPLPWLSTSAIKRINDSLRELAQEKNVLFLDAGKAFHKGGGQIYTDYFLEDEVHLSEKGYRAWAAAIEKSWL